MHSSTFYFGITDEALTYRARESGLYYLYQVQFNEIKRLSLQPRPCQSSSPCWPSRRKNHNRPTRQLWMSWLGALVS
jgi:hypothetical protein